LEDFTGGGWYRVNGIKDGVPRSILAAMLAAAEQIIGQKSTFLFAHQTKI
jgi:hypothetical protein